MNLRSRSEVLVVGGGLAGAAAAVEMARAGCLVTLLEREKTPHDKVCGEFLSVEAVHMLKHLGVSPVALGAVPVHRVRLCSRRTVSSATLPFPALSLSRKRLDAALLEVAGALGVQVRRGAEVRQLTFHAARWHAALRDGEDVQASRAVLACGKHDLHGYPRPPGAQGDLVALKMYLRLTPAQTAELAGSVELLLHPGGYTGLQPAEDGAANLCTLLPRSTLRRLGGRWQNVLEHLRLSSRHAHHRLTAAEPLLDRPLALSAIPYGFVRTRALHPRLWAVGDQAAVIPSFTGDGMSIALFSGIRAAEGMLRGEAATEFQSALHRCLRLQVLRSTALSRALVFAPSRPLLVTAARLWPATLRWTAAATRVPVPAVAALGLAPEFSLPE